MIILFGLNDSAVDVWRNATEPRVPLDVLSEEFRSLVLRSLFPRDHHDGDAWVHVARDGVLPTYDEGLWQVARWFRRFRFGRLHIDNGTLACA